MSQKSLDTVHWCIRPVKNLKGEIELHDIYIDEVWYGSRRTPEYSFEEIKKQIRRDNMEVSET